MTNGDYNPYFRGERLSNDHRQKVITMVGLGLATIVAFGLILATILSTRACSV